MENDDKLFALGEQELWWVMNEQTPDQLVDELGDVDELIRIALEASARIEQLQAEHEKATAVRLAAVRKLRAAGLSHQDVADALGVSRARAQHLAAGRNASGTVEARRREHT